jgi:1A family penicillin-binding protein
VGKPSNNNVKLASKLVNKTLIKFNGFLEFIGKPFYQLIILVVIVATTSPFIVHRIIEKIILKLKFVKKKSAFIFPDTKTNITLKKKQINLYLERFFKSLSLVIKRPKDVIFSFTVTVVIFLVKLAYYLFKLLLLPIKVGFWLIKFSAKVILKLFSFFTPKRRFAGYILRTSLVALILILIVIPILFYQYVLKDLPSPNELTKRKINVSTNIYDRNGELLYRIYEDENRSIIPLADIPIQVRLATLAAEDAEFYDHPGFSIKGISRALIKFIKVGEVTGGSTITQQLVKNTLLGSERTLQRKIREITLATLVEKTYTKDQILEMYLNEVSYGGTSYGIASAAMSYFGKEVNNLTLAESALLAGLPKSPTKYSPHGSNPELAKARQLDVLNLMVVNGYIDNDQRKASENEELTYIPERSTIKAPHFVMYIRAELEEKYGKEYVSHGGLEIITTLDYSIQALAEKAVADELANLSKLNVGNAAVVVLDPKTGEILAMVGSRDYYDREHDGNVNVATSLRQPGSSIKLINYAYALSNNYTAASIIEDTPVVFEVDNQPPYSPKNYDGKFRGDLTLRSAFAESRNVPAVKVLSTYGVSNMIDMGKKLGITSWGEPGNYGLSLTLGGGDVKLIDLAHAYATVANYGNFTPIRYVETIKDYEGNTIEESDCDVYSDDIKLVQDIQGATASSMKIDNFSVDGCVSQQVLDPRVAYILTDILTDNKSRTPAFGSRSQLVIPNHPEVAVKTGTSNDLRDNLTIGYNSDYLVAVWVGNNDNSPMSRIASGLTGASTIWNKIMAALLAEEPVGDWPIPKGLVQLPICPYTGTLACSGCPIVQEWFLEENIPDKACSPEWFKNDDEQNSGSNNEDGNTEIRQIRRGRLLPEAASTISR